MSHGFSASDLFERSKVTEQPAIEPVTLLQLKAQIRRPASFTAEDDLLDSYIEAARIIAENYTGRKFIDQEITLFMDRWPFSQLSDLWWNGTVEGSANALRTKNDFLELPWAPNDEITDVNTFDEANSETIYSATNYFLDNADDDMYARMVFNLNAEFPSGLRNRNSIKVRYRVGYGTSADDVPADIKVGILMIGAYLYRNRGDCNDCSCVAASGAKSFLEPKVIYTVK